MNTLSPIQIQSLNLDKKRGPEGYNPHQYSEEGSACCRGSDLCTPGTQCCGN